MRRKAVNANAGKTGPEGESLPKRFVPDIGLTEYLAAEIPLHVFADRTVLWSVCFEYPTTDERQKHIRKTLRATYKASGQLWLARSGVPTTRVARTEYVPDTSKLAVDGVRPTKSVSVQRSLRYITKQMRYAGETEDENAKIDE